MKYPRSAGIIPVAMLLLPLAACGGGNDGNADNDNDTPAVWEMAAQSPPVGGARGGGAQTAVASGAGAQGSSLGAPVQVMDPKAGLPIFTIQLPPGWTYTAADRPAKPGKDLRVTFR